MTPTDRWRRRAGLIFLAASLLLLIVGFAPPGATLRGLSFLLYWLACAAFAVLALFTALVDLVIVNARGRAERQELARKTAAEIRTVLRVDHGEAGLNEPVADGGTACSPPIRASGESDSISHSCPSAGSTPPGPPPPK